MTIEVSLQGVTRLGVDSSLFIYFAEQNPYFFVLANEFFRRMVLHEYKVVTSYVTFTEVLVKPLKSGDQSLEQMYETMLEGTDVILLPVDKSVARLAADLRARYNLKTPDALQVATALVAGCEAFLTNDVDLKRVAEINVLVLRELTL